SWNSKSASLKRCSMLRRSPVMRLSMAITLKPSFRKRSARCEPRKPAPPVMSTLFLSIYNLPSYTEIRVTKFLHLAKFVQVAAIKNYFAFQDRTKPVKVRRPEFRPFCSDEDRIRAFRRIVRGRTVLNFVPDLPLDVFHRFG